jgi:hypothetical protein
MHLPRVRSSDETHVGMRVVCFVELLIFDRRGTCGARFR